MFKLLGKKIIATLRLNAYLNLWLKIMIANAVDTDYMLPFVLCDLWLYIGKVVIHVTKSRIHIIFLYICEAFYRLKVRHSTNDTRD